MLRTKSRSVLSRFFQLCSQRPSPLPPPTVLKPTILQRRLFFSESSHIIKRPPPPLGSGRLTTHQNVSAPWHDDPRKVAVATAFATGCAYAAARIRYGETEPFTGRTHLALLSHKEARERDEAEFAKFKEDNAYLILDPSHADSIRVRRINDAIVCAAHRGVAMRQARSRAAGTSRRRRSTTDRLHWMDGLEWEVVVIRYLTPSARCFPGAGKIVVYAGLLDYFKTDVEIAATLAHEVAHVIGRHTSGVFDWLDPIVEKMPILIPFLLPFLLFHCRRRELEADQIGMMLLSAAGVDPIIAVLVEEKFAKITEKQGFVLPTHPCSKKRSQFLSRPKIMGEALELYKQVVSHM